MSVPNISLGVTVSIPGLLCVSPQCSLGSTFTACFHLHSQVGHHYSPFSFPITLLIAAPHNRNLTPISLYDFQFLLCFITLFLTYKVTASPHSILVRSVFRLILACTSPLRLIIVRFQPCPSHRASIVGFPSIKPDMQHDHWHTYWCCCLCFLVSNRKKNTDKVTFSTSLQIISLLFVTRNDQQAMGLKHTVFNILHCGMICLYNKGTGLSPSFVLVWQISLFTSRIQNRTFVIQIQAF